MPSESDKWGWEHVSVFGGFDRGSGTKRWKCNHCNLRYNGSYSRVRAHLLGFSGVGVKSCPAIDRSLREAFHILEEERLSRKKKKNSANGKPVKRVRALQPSLTWKAITKEDVDDIVARFFYADGLSIDVVNSPYFHGMVKAIGAFGSGYEPPSIDKLSDSFLMDVDDNGEGDHVFTGALSDSIMEVGPSNVLQIISHLGDACKSSESYILSKFPSIFWSPCTSHSIHMLMEEIAELEWVKPIVLCAKAIEHCMMTYQHSSTCLFIQNLKQSSDPISAKFAPSYCFIQRIFELRQALQEVVVSEEWKQWKNNVAEDVESVESAILGGDFWGKAHLLLQLYEPFVRLLATLDIDKSVIGDVYDWRVQALETLRNMAIDVDILNQLEGMIENKWDVLFSPLHAAGYILNPRYIGKFQTKEKSVMRGWKATLERYEVESAARRVLREQLSSYWHLEGSLGEEDAVDCRDKMDPVAWWENFGFETPSLQTLAIKVLSQVSSVAMCQEIWQTNDVLCQETANRLGVQRAEDLLFVRNNLRLHCQRNGSLSSSPGQRNAMSSSSGVKTWDGSNLDQTKAISSIHDNL
ncbi:hypothetical protein GH714_015407 [Hevea brasiliensis]|uniref:DUF659 domain-containing protein n=1 Tax=Hevea brasiliensis TaxID=3981 RepID=A0A6A6LH28_HEVBR|nr:hypothetical protein GH714_015407 [Hevea brasiliensis]